MSERKRNIDGYIAIYCDICGTYLVTLDVIEDSYEIDDVWYKCRVCSNKLHPKKDWSKKINTGVIENE